MAKKKGDASQIEKTSFSELDSLIGEEFSELIDISKVDNDVKDWFSLGNYALNYACSKRLTGAVPSGRITSFWGLSSTGKSLLMAGLAKDPNVDMVIVISCEGGGISKSIFDFIGAPVEKVRYLPVTTFTNYKVSKEDGSIEEVTDKDLPAKLDTDKYVYHKGLINIMKKFISQIEYKGVKSNIVILLDSIANVKSVREFTGTQDMGMKGKNLNDLFSSIDNSIERTNVSFVFSNKVYTNFGNVYDPFKQSGGESVIYNPSLSVKLTATQDSDDVSDAELKEEKLRRKTALGSSLKTVRATISKSRFGTESRNATFLIDSCYGIMKNSGLFEMLKDFNILVKNGNFYSIPGIIDESFLKKNFTEIFSKNEEKYIPLLQARLEKEEERIKKSRIGLDISDISELREAEERIDEDEDDSFDISQMEADA